MKQILIFVLVTAVAVNCGNINPPIPMFKDPDQSILGQIIVPEGFEVSIFAEGVKNARSMVYSPNGVLFVGTRDKGDVYAIVDDDKDFKADTIYTIAKKLRMPNGVAFKDGHLYVAEVSRILKFSDIENKLSNPPIPEVIYENYPTERHHGWKYIAFGPDGKLYVPVGAPCNICESEEEVFNTITRIDPDGKNMEIIQKGVRNTVGFDWHPETGELWFTDNGRDWMGDDQPFCELNRAERDGLHFGYPYCHQGNLSDPEFGQKFPCSDFVAPAKNLGAHVAPLGMEFYLGDQFPSEYKGQIFVAEHGSWNRTKKSGYRVMMAKLNGNEVIDYIPFAYGWLNAENDEVSGRPVDIEMLPDGSILVSDDFADMIYRITYKQ
jgi:glucose/arabinose dehydrogenase